jgi:hypothetical protein
MASGVRRPGRRAPRAVPPADAPAEAIERVAPRRQAIVAGDVVVAREPLPKINPKPLSPDPQSRYRVYTEAEMSLPQHFTSFAAAAARAEELAGRRRSRIMFIEDGVVSLLADHRRRP